MTELPTGTVTFLFTDLEGSTRLWEEHPEAMKAALARHDEILRDAVAAHDGHIVKMTGDGAHAAFGTADSATRAALDAQRALATEAWGDTGELQVRMGIHTGRADHRDGDYFGTAVNRAARLMNAAHGGQVVVSLATEELLRDGMPAGLSLLDLGEHGLRDLAGREHVFQLEADGLRREFPRLRSLDAYLGNLPAQLTSFVGRGAELDAIARALDEWRMVTLTGVGGVGKTRLALQVAAELLPRFVDGAWFCELAAAIDADSFGQVVAATIGAQPRPGVSLVGSVTDYLRSKRQLLVLDNCEHLLEPSGDLAESVLGSCPGVRIIATSREGLGVAGEHVWPLASLPLPGGTASADTAASNDAVRLFADRASAARAQFVLDSSSIQPVTEICTRLDGIPLAIELAAARVASMSPAEIAARVDERFRLLTGGRRTAVERHQTLRATVDWSYSLLEPRDRAVFDRLGVFSGGFDQQAAEAVVTGDGIEEWDVFDALGALVVKSLVNLEPRSDGSSRYTLLETLRQYARERLDDEGTTDAWRRRHAEYYAAFAEEAGPALLGPDEMRWRARFRAELDNLRAAIAWSLDSADHSDGELAVRAVAALADQAHIDRGGTVGEWALAALDAAERSTEGRRAAVHAAAGSAAAFHQGDYETARRLLAPLVDDRVPPDCPAPSLAYVSGGILETLVGDRGRSGDIFRTGHSVLDALGGDQRFGHSMLWSMAADCRIGAGEHDIALVEARRALEIARALGNPTAVSNALYALGWASENDDPDATLAAFDEAFALETGDDGAVISVMWGLALAVRARVFARRGDPGSALVALRDALRFGDETGDRTNVYGASWIGVDVLVELGRTEAGTTLAASMIAGVLAPVSRLAPSAADELMQVVENARADLGDAAFDVAFGRGVSMSYDEILAFALATIDDLIGELGVADA